MLDFKYKKPELCFLFSKYLESFYRNVLKTHEKYEIPEQYSLIICCVPCFPDRKYNQAFLLAKYFYKFLKTVTPLRFNKNIKFVPEFFYRVKNTRKLHDKSASERKRELENAFKIGENAEIEVREQCQKILIVDDIVTTGTTINELGKILIDKGIKKENIIGLTALGRNYH